MRKLAKVIKDNKNYVLWSEVNEDFNKAKEAVYALLGKSEVDGDHSIGMDFHFILNDEQLLKLEDSL